MRLYVGVGEASGDRIAALILRALRAQYPGLIVHGFCGPLCAAEGLTSTHSLADLAVNGIGDVVRRGVFLLRARAALIKQMETFMPDVVLLVDYPGMNVPLARRARALGLRVLYVAPPQLWAYKNPARRLERLRRSLAGVPLHVLLPFEAASYEAWGAPVTQGHFFPYPAFEAARGTRLLLCPGSRRGVLRRNLPLWLKCVHEFFGTLDGVDILVPDYLSAEARTLCGAACRDAGAAGPAIITDAADGFARAGAAIAFPGTITLELFLQRIPTRVWGVVDPLTWWAGRRALRGPYVALPNVIALGAGLPAVFPEWIGTAADFRRAPPVIPEARADWSPAATADSLHAVWLSMGSDQGVETVLATLR